MPYLMLNQQNTKTNQSNGIHQLQPRHTRISWFPCEKPQHKPQDDKHSCKHIGHKGHVIEKSSLDKGMVRIHVNSMRDQLSQPKRVHDLLTNLLEARKLTFFAGEGQNIGEVILNPVELFKF